MPKSQIPLVRTLKLLLSNAEFFRASENATKHPPPEASEWFQRRWRMQPWQFQVNLRIVICLPMCLDCYNNVALEESERWCSAVPSMASIREKARTQRSARARKDPPRTASWCPRASHPPAQPLIAGGRSCRSCVTAKPHKHLGHPN